jgi:hypothetical protein
MHLVKVDASSLAVISKMTVTLHNNYYFNGKDIKLINDDEMHFIFISFYVYGASPNYFNTMYYGYVDFSVSLTNLKIVELKEFRMLSDPNSVYSARIKDSTHFYTVGYAQTIYLNGADSLIKPYGGVVGFI